MKKYLIIFHILLLTALVAGTFIEPEEFIVVTFIPLLLIILIIVFLLMESKYIMIPSVLLLFLSTIAFAMMVIGNIAWSEGTILIVIVGYLLFLTFEIVTIVFAFKHFKKQN